MTTATIHFTAKLDLNSPLWPEGITDEEKLQGWIFEARKEPMLAIECLVFDITGEIDKGCEMSEEFERKASALGYDLTEGHTQRYAYENTQSAWELWQAASAHKDSEFAKERDQLCAEIAMQAEALKPLAGLLQEHNHKGDDERPIFAINDAMITLGDLRLAVSSISAAPQPDAAIRAKGN